MRCIGWLAAGLLAPYGVYLASPAWPWLAVLGVLLLRQVWRRRLVVLVALAGACWTVHHIERQAQAWHQFEAPRQLLIQGRIRDLPQMRNDSLAFLFEITVATGSIAAGTRMRLHCFRCEFDIRSGETWRFEVNTRPARSRRNAQGFDRERWYFAHRVAALGSVVDGTLVRPAPVYDPDRIRQALSDRIDSMLSGHPSLPVMAALALADRRALDELEWDRYRVTGTAHLLAISGMHIGLAAWLGFAFSHLLLLGLPLRLRLAHGANLRWALGFGVATIYAALAGFPVSTRRALLMLAAWMAYDRLGRSLTPGSAWTMALAAVLLLDPLSPLMAGFWLSFGAVGALIWMFAPRTTRTSRWRTLVRAQGAVMLLTAPLAAMLFQQVAPAGLLVNLVAIPWLSLFVVPPLITGILAHWWAESPGAFLVILAAENLRWLSALLEVCQRLGAATLDVRLPGPFVGVMAVAAALCLTMPRGIPQRVAGLSLALPLLWRAPGPPNLLDLTLLDTGQGLAAIAATPNHALLYDTGPGDLHHWSLARAVLEPAFAAAGRVPGRVVLSHADLDHAGGVADLDAAHPYLQWMSTAAGMPPGAEACRAGRHWHWEGVEFTVLHPAAGLPYLGNDSSCVLQIIADSWRILLPGDIGAAVEQRLLLQGIGRQDIIVAAHHGSRHSSLPEFVAATRPALVLVAAGHGNRYGFPAPEVVARFSHVGSRLWTTADCGAISISLNRDATPVTRSARSRQPPPWSWPAAPGCP